VKDRRAEQTASAVPERAPQDGEIRARWAWVEPVVWTERMLATLETGIEGGKWFRLTAQCLLHHGWPVLLKTGACCGLPIFFEVTTNWRAGCQKLACPVRREGRPESSSLPLSAPAAEQLGPIISRMAFCQTIPFSSQPSSPLRTRSASFLPRRST